MKNIVKFAVGNPVTICMVVFALLLLGKVSYDQLSVDLLPDLNNPRLFIELKAGERPPGEIEKQFIEFYHKNSENPKAEIYIPFVVDELIKQKAVKVKVLNTSAKWFGVTYKEDTELVNNALQKFDGEGLYTDMGQ